MGTKMLRVVLCCGIPTSGKSFWSKSEVDKDPNNVVRINRDSLREMMNNSSFSVVNEKMITATTNFMLQSALKAGKSVILDETNLNNKNFNSVCKIVKELNIDCIVMEKPFYIELDAATQRDASRVGKAVVGEDVIKKFWKKSGGKQHQHYKAKCETFLKQSNKLSWAPLVQDKSLSKAIICDLDGTLCTIGDRSPYSAKNCDLVDRPNDFVINTVKLYSDAGYKVIFCSGRMDEDREPTERFIKKYLPELEYSLFMRQTGDQRKDSIIKEEIFNRDIFGKYNVELVLDDRLQVCRQWYKMGLNLLRVGDPEANF
jgi:predicted kinase